MPDPDRLLRTLEKAAQVVTSTSGRRGRLVRLDGAKEVLVAGDLHGNVENFRQLLQHAALSRYPSRHLVLQELIHGPFQYAEGGDKSHQLVDLVAALKCQYPAQVHLILGNHELAQWMGHMITKTDFEMTTHFRMGVDRAYGKRSAEIYGSYLQLLARLPVAVRTANRVFISHSLPWMEQLETFDPGVLEREEIDRDQLRYGGSIHSLVWGRDVSLETTSAFLQKIDADLLISGHVPCADGYLAPNERQLVLDTMGSPAAFCLFPADQPISHSELIACVRFL
jgi:hypothetical protein